MRWRLHATHNGSGFRRRALALPVADSIPVTNLALMGVASLGLVVTARHLGVSDRGVYLTWSTWSATIGILALLGTQSFIVVAADQLATTVSVYRLRSMLLLGSTLAIGVSFLAMMGLGAGGLAVAGGVLLASSSPVTAVNAAVQQANGNHNWRFNVARGLAPVFGFISMVTALIAFRPGPELLFFALGLGSFIGAVASVVVVRQPAPVESRLIPLILRLSKRGGPLGILGWLLLSVDTVIVSLAGTSEDVGLYGVGVAARSIVMAFGMAVGLRWFAKRQAIGSLLRATRAFLPASVVALAIAVVSPVVVPTVLGLDFSPSVSTVQAMAAGAVLASIDYLLTQFVLVRVGYLWPTILRTMLVVTLVVGIIVVDGQPTYSALVYCSVMLLSVLGQFALARFRPRR